MLNESYVHISLAKKMLNNSSCSLGFVTKALSHNFTIYIILLDEGAWHSLNSKVKPKSAVSISLINLHDRLQR